MLILITGASKGIGFEMVKFFSQNTNHLVIDISRNIGPLKTYIRKENTNSVLAIKTDITNPDDLKKLFKSIKALNIGLDVIINNAGLLLNKPFDKITASELQLIYTTNVFAPFALVQLMLPLMNQTKGSHIVNISSMGGFQGSTKFSGLSAYSSSKAALCGLTESLAEELKPKRIAVNCLALGAVQTEMLSKAFPGYKAPITPKTMAEFICNFAITGHHFFNGKILPVSSTTP